MNVWIFHPAADIDENNITNLSVIDMPWPAMPNLSQVGSNQELRKLLAQLNPDMPPESISLRAQVIWHVLTGVQKETIIVVVLRKTQKLAFAEITGAYAYVPANVGSPARHTYPVRWYRRIRPVAVAGGFKNVILDDSMAMHEVNNPQLRKQILNQLPLGYNRFRKLGWLVAIGFGIHMLKMLHRMIDQQGM